MENENFAEKVKELSSRRDGILSELQRLIGPYKAEQQIMRADRPFRPKVVFTRVKEVRAPEIDRRGRILVYPAAVDEDRTTVYSGVKICLPEGIGVIFTRVDGDKSEPCGILLPGDHNELTFGFGPSEVNPGPADGPLATPFVQGTFFRIPEVSLEETLNSVFQDFADGKISG